MTHEELCAMLQKTPSSIKLDKQQTINKVLKNFNFEEVHKVMQYLDWQWVSSNTDDQIPSIAEMVVLSNDLLNRAYDEVMYKMESESNLETGGFKVNAAKYSDGEIVLTLQFVVTGFNYSNKGTCY